MIEILNWIACILTIYGTWEVQKKDCNLLYINIIYCISSSIFIIVFILKAMFINIFLYCILVFFAIRGIIHHKR